MKAGPMFSKPMNNQSGTVLVLVALLSFVLIGFTALAVDIGHLVVVKNELQNAADAGALAGASNLYYTDVTAPTPADIGWVNPNSNQEASDTALFNASENLAVDVNLPRTNVNDVQRGHWSFKTKTVNPLTGEMDQFTPAPPGHSLAPPNLIGVTEDQLDADTSFINAVRVVARRETPPASSFFARIFGFDEFFLSAEAVAYIGFEGIILESITAPIVLCEEALLDENGAYQCHRTRLINSSDKLTSNTGAWTNISMGCTDQFDANDLKSIVNDECNEITLDEPIRAPIGLSVGGGQVQKPFDDMRHCAGFFTEKELNKDPSLTLTQAPWTISVPVVSCCDPPFNGECPGKLPNPTGCLPVTGSVTMEVVMITSEFPSDPTKKYDDLVPQMSGCVNEDNPECTDGVWDGSGLTDVDRWLSFVDAFNLQIDIGTPAGPDDYFQKTHYAKPTCSEQPPGGGSGGMNFNKLAQIPILVR